MSLLITVFALGPIRRSSSIIVAAVIHSLQLSWQQTYAFIKNETKPMITIFSLKNQLKQTDNENSWT